jgi:sensor histidine kinase YesM
MAQAASPAVDTVLRAIDERWWLRHTLFWAVDTALLVPFFLYDLQSTTDARRAAFDALLLLSPHLLAAYALLYGVVPWLWRPARRGRFVGLLLGWFLLSPLWLFAFRFFVFIPLHTGVVSDLREYHTVVSIGPYMLLLSTSGVVACLGLFRHWRQKELANARLVQENFQAELQLLKAQIHPHFLFNTLNNLYSLTLKQSEQAPVVVDRLTGLLQFVLEQGNAPLVSLADEVALLRNFSALEQLRYGPRLTLVFEAEGIGATGQIAPLLMLPLVENAFKHGSAEVLGQAYIRIHLAVAEGTLQFLVTNSRSCETAAASTAGAQGIGLRNVRHRLELLYPQRHQLVIEDHAETFTVRLSLRLAAPEAAPLTQSVDTIETDAAPAFSLPTPSLLRS